MQELKLNLRPCPFCGCTEIGIEPVNRYRTSLFCRRCHATFRGADEDKLVEKWNRRDTNYLTGKTEAGTRKVTIFRPHVEIRIYVNDEMMEDYKACNMLTPEQIMEDGKCAHCELNSTLYPGACMSLCDIPELRQALEERTWYGE